MAANEVNGLNNLWRRWKSSRKRVVYIQTISSHSAHLFQFNMEIYRVMFTTQQSKWLFLINSITTFGILLLEPTAEKNGLPCSFFVSMCWALFSRAQSFIQTHTHTHCLSSGPVSHIYHVFCWTNTLLFAFVMAFGRKLFPICRATLHLNRKINKLFFA